MKMIDRKQIDSTSLFVVSFATFLGGVTRFFPVLLHDFPLNDGGLFFQMTQDILNDNFSLPLYTSYNNNGIPFGYPPAAFYLMAFLQRFFHFGILDQLHFLPAFLSTLTIPAFYCLSRNITGSKARSIFAVFAFALMPRSYLWLIMGGGITRALGLFFGILAIIAIWNMFQKPQITSIVLAVFCSSLTILSHLETAWFVLLTALLIGIRYGLNKQGIQFAALTALGVLCLTSPWWVSLIQHFGVTIFLDAAHSGRLFSFLLAMFYFTGEPFVDILAVVILLGLFAELVRQRFFLAAWLLLISMLSARSGPTFATIPGSMLFGSGVVWVIVPGITSYTKLVPENDPELDDILKVRISKFALSTLLFYALFSAILAPFSGNTAIRKLTAYDRQAMAWIAQNTPSGRQFTVMTGEPYWEADPVSEWFPALTKRISVATVQGSEWLPGQAFSQQIKRYELLQNCAEQDMACILDWEKNADFTGAYLYLRRPQAGEENSYFPVFYSVMQSGHYQLIFENQGASIFKADH